MPADDRRPDDAAPLPTTTLIKPSVARSACARSFSANGHVTDFASILLFGLGLGQAHVGELGVGVGDPRNRAVVGLGRQTEQRVADDDAGVIAGDVRELEAAGDVADGEDALLVLRSR